MTNQPRADSTRLAPDKNQWEPFIGGGQGLGDEGRRGPRAARFRYLGPCRAGLGWAGRLGRSGAEQQVSARPVRYGDVIRVQTHIHTHCTAMQCHSAQCLSDSNSVALWSPPRAGGAHMPRGPNARLLACGSRKKNSHIHTSTRRHETTNENVLIGMSGEVRYRVSGRPGRDGCV